jgi:VanZ family protein
LSHADRWVTRAALAFGLFYLYGSLAPLNVQAIAPGLAWERFVSLPGPWSGPLSRVDVAVNVLLTVPLAFALAHLAGTLQSPAVRWLARCAAPAALALLAVAVEWAQVFVPSRDPSWSDVAAQWIGIAAGTLVHALWGARWRALLAGMGSGQPAGGRLRSWLALYLLGLLAYNLMPLDLSISPVELYRKWRDGRVLLLPLAGSTATGWELAYELITDAAVWLPAGALWRLDAPAAATRRLFLRGLLWAAALELAQLPVLSRVSDITDVLLGGCGVALGAMLPALARRWRAAAPALRRQVLWGLAAGWLGAAVLVLWLPFDFDLGRGQPRAWSAMLFEVPGSTYFQRGEFGALNEILRKLLLFVPAGLLLAAWRLPRAGARAGLVALGLLALALEAGQVLLPGRTASLTDAWLALLGAWAGLRIGQGIAALPATPAAPVAPTAPVPGVPRSEAPVRLRKPAANGLAAAGLSIALGATLLWGFSRLPGVPYNVAKLMPHGAPGLLAAVGLAIALWWMVAAPLAACGPTWRLARLWLPAALLAHALATFSLLRAAVPLPMLHKIIGNPVLGWPGWWEDLGRYLALHVALMLPLVGAAWLLRILLQPKALPDLLAWAFWALLLAWPLHGVIVDQAATDNLVELMRGGGGFMVSAALALALMGVALAGGLLALASLQRRHRWRRAAAALLGLAAAALLLHAALEPVLVKYGQAFSALQFLLSAGRQQYATGPELAVRLVLALLLACAAVALLQRPGWARLLGDQSGAAAAPGAVVRPRRRP